MINIAISGAAGKMGKRIIHCVSQDSDCKLVCLLERSDSSAIGEKVAGLPISSDSNLIQKADVLIEFTSPEATLVHLAVCEKLKKAMVIGTTGLTQEQQAKIAKAAEHTPIVYSPNMSVGVNLLFSLLRQAVQTLSERYKVHITEAHHIHKKDAPSGTAKKLAAIIQERGVHKLGDIQSIREGEITGDHEIRFESEEDIITLSHSAKNARYFCTRCSRGGKIYYRQESRML